MHIAVIGSGVAGLSAAWLLSHNHTVDLFEKDDRLGGHANTQSVKTASGNVTVDTGFIVYNEKTYPNLTALFDHIGLETAASDMSFGASLNAGQQEYCGQGLKGVFAQPSNIFNAGFLLMLKDVRRFYNEATNDVGKHLYANATLGQYLSQKRYSDRFIKDHLLPMGAAIWSMPSEQMLAFPFVSFMRFSINHGLVQFKDRPQWRTVPGGSKRYVDKLSQAISGEVFLNQAVIDMDRRPGSVRVTTRQGLERKYDQVVLACHSDQALRILATSDVSQAERDVLSAIPYQSNLAILHKDASLMPKRKAAWASWNYIQDKRKDEEADAALCVTYWMNKLQPLSCEEDLFVTLNPIKAPAEGTILRSSIYHHPVFSMQAIEAQKKLWSLQGKRRTWFCGAYFGYGFHEDGIQAGLAVAEQLGGAKRPWNVEHPSGRIYVETPTSTIAQQKWTAGRTAAE